MVLALLLALQSASSKPAPDPAVLDELIRRTNGLVAFVAEYRLGDGEDEHTLRFTYRAPDELRVELPGPTVGCMRKGVMELRQSRPGAKALTARTPLAEPFDARFAEVTRAMHAEFPASSADWPEAGGNGLQLQMLIAPDPSDAKREEFSFSAAYVATRGALLGWLDALKHAEIRAVEDAEHVSFTTPRGAKVTISSRTGFLEFTEKPSEGGMSTCRLESLDLAPKLSEKDFELPEAAANAQDVSADLSARMQRTLTAAARTRIFRFVSVQVGGGKIEWNAEARAHLERVLETLHAGGFVLEEAASIASMKRWTEKTASELGDAYGSAAAGDASKRGEIDGKVNAMRGKLVERLNRVRDERLSSLSIEPATVPDAELRKGFADVEEAAVRAAFRQALEGPLLGAFEAAVMKASAGK